MNSIGISGSIAKAFIKSKLTPILVIAALLSGVFALIVTPREEEPQIVVPMIDIFVSYPGASAKEVEERVTRPMEKFLYEIKGVEYVYSIAKPGMNLTIVRFYVGHDMEDAIVKVYNKLMSHYDLIPEGVSQPIVKPRSIDDVPILSYTLWSDRYTSYELRRLALELCTELKKDKDISETHVIGGQRRQIRVILNPADLRAYNLSALQIMQAIKSANVKLPAGSLQNENREILLEAGGFLRTPEEVGSVVVGVYNGRPVYLRNVARIVDGPQEPENYVFMGFGPQAERKIKGLKPEGRQLYEAVTIAIAKKKGTNATEIAKRVEKKIEDLKGKLIPLDVQITETRNYGETAKEKSDELLKHILIATFSVVLLIAITLGWREAIVVAVAVPVTLALTLLINYLYGYTLNRVTLFALIFSIGILVDDAIVVVENIHRHFKLHRISPLTAVLAVDEVGNPTILATFTVIAALLPMAFVSGLMGPYMRPIPVGASAAMLLSLLVAFIVSPWMSYIVLKKIKRTEANSGHHEKSGEKLFEIYGRILGPLIDNPKKRYLALAGVLVLLIGALALLPLKMVTVKMLPFDNKSELQVIIDMPEGTTLEETTRVATELAQYIKTVPEVTDYQIYAGTAAPFNFNGLVRHYYLRSGPNVADIQVNFVPKGERSAQSHDIAKRIRGPLTEIAKRYGARIKIAEIPPGPPVLSTLVTEVYGPDHRRQIEIARKIKEIYESTEGVVDVDWYVEDDQEKLVFEVDKEKAAYHGVSTEAISQSLRIALGGMPAGLSHLEDEKEPVEIYLRLPVEERTRIESLRSVTVPTPRGNIPLSELVRVKRTTEDKTIYHKNLQRVVYVTGDVAGKEESPVYAILKMKKAIKELKIPEGYTIKQYYARQPYLEDRYSIKWDGEWHITYEVFRDLGIAFAVVLVLIYILVVAWFKHFVTPLIIMAPIPLTLVGIMPGHWLFGAFFTATSMIGFIALAGIIVRNSILLIDFIQMEWRNCGNLKEALIKAGAVRFRPIALTAMAVVVGSFVMIFDPIFQGLAIAMMFGAVASTALTLLAVPLLYYEYFKTRLCPVKAEELEEKEPLDEMSEI